MALESLFGAGGERSTRHPRTAALLWWRKARSGRTFAQPKSSAPTREGPTMADCIDPGPGWRLLAAGEIVRWG